jgi:hypothetical protein
MTAFRAIRAWRPENERLGMCAESRRLEPAFDMSHLEVWARATITNAYLYFVSSPWTSYQHIILSPSSPNLQLDVPASKQANVNVLSSQYIFPCAVHYYGALR